MSPSSNSQEQAGFTLIEVVVALAIVALAGLALLNAQGENARAAGAVEERFFASIVADNRLAETMAQVQTPAYGTTSGEVTLAGRDWQWTQAVVATAQAEIRRIDVTVQLDGRDQVLAAYAAFRGDH